MKVMLINGSSRSNGCTNVALRQIEKTLNAEGIDTHMIFLGNAPVPDCIACGKCRETGRCAFNDIVCDIADEAKTCDGFVFGSPVYYAHPSARLLAVLDRAFFSSASSFAFKPAASVLSARRAGTTAAFDVMNKYFTISSMPVVSSTYWNHVYGAEPEEVSQDEEGLMTMTNIAKNMAWLLKCIELGKKNNLEHPSNEKLFTNFTR